MSTSQSNEDKELDKLVEELIFASFTVAHNSSSHSANQWKQKTSVKDAKQNLIARIRQAEIRARIDGILEGFKMSGEGFNGEYPYGDRDASDDEILADILSPELEQQLYLNEEKK